MNITDIDDKTIRDSQKWEKTLKEFTEFYTEAFLADLSQLAIFVVPIRSLRSLPLSMRWWTIINWLIRKGHAYLADDGSIYYRVGKFKRYGELAHLDMSGMKSSVRINNDEYDKDNVADFALWKAYDSRFWRTRINGKEEFLIDGKDVILTGRPGWHIECSACNYRYFWRTDRHPYGRDRQSFSSSPKWSRSNRSIHWEAILEILDAWRSLACR
jgi:cysteinyl-tRNA synthetase